MNESLIRGKF